MKIFENFNNLVSCLFRKRATENFIKLEFPFDKMNLNPALKSSKRYIFDLRLSKHFSVQCELHVSLQYVYCNLVFRQDICWNSLIYAWFFMELIRFFLIFLFPIVVVWMYLKP